MRSRACAYQKEKKAKKKEKERKKKKREKNKTTKKRKKKIVCFVTINAYECICCACGGQKGAPNPLEMELKTVVSHDLDTGN